MGEGLKGVGYDDSRVLRLLKTFSRIFDYSMFKAGQLMKSRQKLTFKVLHVDNKGYTFNRDRPMNATAFVDTNIPVYAHADSDP